MMSSASANLQAHAVGSPDAAVACAVAAAREGGSALREALEGIPAPIYVADEAGWITYFNRACVDFAGRTPVVGQDRWCVTWRLYTEDGVPLPHDECPMAVAIKEKRPLRGAVAIAERPDGSKVLFTPYPTPIVDEDDRVVGAVNMLIDITDHRQAAALKEQAERCRRLARAIGEERTVRILRSMAHEYEAKARALAPFCGPPAGARTRG
jgi:PAS domain S-box-containing protein